MIRLLIPVLLIVFSISSSAKKFATDYVSFDLLNNWHCHPEGTEWICTNKLNRKKASEAMIILTAKQKGPSDSMAQYINHLKAPRTVKKARGGTFTSKVFHAKQRHINGHMWVDGFHQGSEVPVYYTRYLVTIKGSLGILVTYSAHKDHYKKYASDFAASINSLRVMNVSPSFSGGKGSVGMGNVKDYLQDMIDADDELGGKGDDEDESGGLADLLGVSPEVLGGLAALTAVGGYLFYRMRRKRQLRAAAARDAESSRSSSRRDRSSSGRNRSRRPSRGTSSSRRKP